MCDRLSAQMGELKLDIDRICATTNKLYDIVASLVNYAPTISPDEKKTSDIGIQTVDPYSLNNYSMNSELSTEVEGIKLDMVIMEAKSLSGIRSNTQAIDLIRAEIASVQDGYKKVIQQVGCSYNGEVNEVNNTEINYRLGKENNELEALKVELEDCKTKLHNAEQINVLNQPCGFPTTMVHYNVASKSNLINSKTKLHNPEQIISLNQPCGTPITMAHYNVASKSTKNSINSKQPSSALKTKPSIKKRGMCDAINQSSKQKQSSIVNTDGEIITSDLSISPSASWPLQEWLGYLPLVEIPKPNNQITARQQMPAHPDSLKQTSDSPTRQRNGSQSHFRRSCSSNFPPYCRRPSQTSEWLSHLSLVHWLTRT